MTIYTWTIAVFVGSFAFGPAFASLTGIYPAFRFWICFSNFALWYALGYFLYLAGILE